MQGVGSYMSASAEEDIYEQERRDLRNRYAGTYLPGAPNVAGINGVNYGLMQPAAPQNVSMTEYAKQRYFAA